jgi:hypothetical protein
LSKAQPCKLSGWPSSRPSLGSVAEPVSSCSRTGRITSHPVGAPAPDHNPSCLRASGSGGGTILFDGLSQPGGISAVTTRPDPADRSRSGPPKGCLGVGGR